MRRDDRPEVIPCDANPDYECVRIDTQTADGTVATPPPGSDPARAEQPLCPDGYVPRRRRRTQDVPGKRVMQKESPE